MKLQTIVIFLLSVLVCCYSVPGINATTNVPPVVKIITQNTTQPDIITLDGTQSYDPDGKIDKSSYLWRVIEGSAANITKGDDGIIKFKIKSPILVELTLMDDQRAIASKSVRVYSAVSLPSSEDITPDVINAANQSGILTNDTLNSKQAKSVVSDQLPPREFIIDRSPSNDTSEITQDAPPNQEAIPPTNDTSEITQDAPPNQEAIPPTNDTSEMTQDASNQDASP